MAILDLRQIEADAATKNLLDYAQQNGIDTTGFELIGIECDVASEESVVIAFEQIKMRFGRVDAVVASAGMFLVRVWSLVGSLLKGIVENYSALECARKPAVPFNREFTVCCL